MSILNLDKIFKPESVVLIGASEKPGSLGTVVLKNIMKGNFSGEVFPVNPKYKEVCGLKSYAQVSSLPFAPDLAVICTPANTIPEIVKQLGESGTRAAVILSAGFHGKNTDINLDQAVLDAAKPYGFRILGPNCIGLLIPHLNLNASFAHTDSYKGNLAFVSQSGALCTTVLDWAKSRNIGFSYFISLGDSLDIDFGDLLDYLSTDRKTHGILLYIESIKEARKFMSAARATSRNIPVIVIKSGRVREGAEAATSHTGALAGGDDIFGAAIRRAGMLRVYTITELFDAVETLARAKPVKGNRLAIVTNGGGPGVIATDELIESGGTLAKLSENTITSLSQVLPYTWSQRNPIDIIGDADADRYVNALNILLTDTNYDAILIMLVPSAVIDNEQVASAIVKELKNLKTSILTCWLGEGAVENARQIFVDAGVPTYETTTSAIRAFLQMVDYFNNQQSLMQTPPSVPEDFQPDTIAARKIIDDALKQNRSSLTETEAKEILNSYRIPVVTTLTASTVEEVIQHAEKLGYPVALKILSPDITHKSDVGGVLLNIDSKSILQNAAEGMLNRIHRMQPQARIDGFSVQKMIFRPDAYELIAGISTDPVFGPFILFGHGGTAVEIINDKAVALPPLNMKLASELIDRTRISRLLKGYRDKSSINLSQLLITLVKLSHLIIDIPEIVELDINPLLADEKGVVALDARIFIKETPLSGAQRLAIRPYPKELEEQVTLKDGTPLLIRPIKPEDEPAHLEFFKKLTPQDITFRFFRAVNMMPHQSLARFTQIDYEREMAFIAIKHDITTNDQTIGVIRVVADANNNEAEIAIIVRPDMHRKGLGKLLMQKTIDYCKERGINKIVGQVLMENKAMLKLAAQFNFDITACYEDSAMSIVLNL